MGLHETLASRFFTFVRLFGCFGVDPFFLFELHSLHTPLLLLTPPFLYTYTHSFTLLHSAHPAPLTTRTQTGK